MQEWVRGQELSEDEVLHLFLRTELHSTRFSLRLFDQLNRLGLDRRLIDNADLSSEMENQQRRQVMDYRGYVSRLPGQLFEGFPTDVKWHETFMTTAQLLDNALYINDHSYWHQFTCGTRRPRDAAKTFARPDVMTDPAINRLYKDIKIFANHIEGVRAVTKIIEAGQFAQLPPMIFVTEGERLVNLEGHARMSSLALATQGQPQQPFKAIIGHSAKMPGWRYF